MDTSCCNIPDQVWLLLMPGFGPPHGSYNTSWEQSPFVLGATQQEPQGILRLAATCLGFVELDEILQRSEAQAQAGHCVEENWKGLRQW